MGDFSRNMLQFQFLMGRCGEKAGTGAIHIYFITSVGPRIVLMLRVRLQNVSELCSAAGESDDWSAAAVRPAPPLQANKHSLNIHSTNLYSALAASQPDRIRKISVCELCNRNALCIDKDETRAWTLGPLRSAVLKFSASQLNSEAH